MGCPRPKYFFSGLTNLLPQKIRLPLFLFSLESVTSGEAPEGTGSGWKNLLNRQTPPVLLLYIRLGTNQTYKYFIIIKP